MTTRTVTKCPTLLGKNCCEHGDHEAPVGKRFCSPDCARCELADFDATHAECAGLCGARALDKARGK